MCIIIVGDRVSGTFTAYVTVKIHTNPDPAVLFVEIYLAGTPTEMKGDCCRSVFFI